MRKLVAFTFASVLLVAACGDLGTLTLGEGILPTYDVDVTIDRKFGQPAAEACPAGVHTVTDAETQQSVTFTVAVVEGGCSVSFAQDDLLLFDEDLVRDTSDRLDGRQIQGVTAAAVVVKDFSLTDDATGAAVDLDSHVSAVDVSIDGTTLLDRADLLAVQSGPVRKTLPQATLDKLLQGINQGTAVSVDVVMEVVFPDSALDELPQVLHLLATIQPEVTIDVVQAASMLD